jgi:hypothetical protein
MIALNMNDPDVADDQSLEDPEAKSLLGENNKDKAKPHETNGTKTAIACPIKSQNGLLLISMGLNQLFLVLLFLRWHDFDVDPTRASVVHAGTGGDTSYGQTTGGAYNIRPDVAVVYGHVQVAKTVDTEINGELASHFERVCGHKGYSYDAYEFNKRVKASGENATLEHTSMDLISIQYKDFNRGRVPLPVMEEIGFEDCDYISLKAPWETWNKFKEWPSLELHVPCRDPLSHLMSQCKHKSRHFNCTAEDLPYEISKCWVIAGRFSRALGKQKNTDLKCFNPIPMEPYLEYMSKRLQRKRVESTYMHQDSNKPHDKDSECIWNEPHVANQVRNILLDEYDYYTWCEECLGSQDDLLVNAQ